MKTQQQALAAVAARAAAVLEDLQFMADHGVGATEAATRTGYRSAKSLDRFIRRHGRHDLARRLARQDPIDLGGRGPTRHLRRAS